MKLLIIDNNGDEDDVVIDNIQELRDFTENMLEQYFEAYSDYGNPVRSIMRYVANDVLVSILVDYNYTVKEIKL